MLRQINRVFLHDVLAAFAGGGVGLDGIHRAYDTQILLPGDWDIPERKTIHHLRRDSLLFSENVTDGWGHLVPWYEKKPKTTTIGRVLSHTPILSGRRNRKTVSGGMS